MRKVHPQVVRLTRVHSVLLYSPRLHFVQRKIRPALCVGQKYTLCGVKNTFHSSLKCGSQPCSRFSCNIQQKTISNILFQKIAIKLQRGSFSKFLQKLKLTDRDKNISQINPSFSFASVSKIWSVGQIIDRQR